MEEPFPGRNVGLNGANPVVDVADITSSSEKFERRAGQAGQDYESGVSSVSDSEQQQATLEAADSWETGVQNAIQNGTFEDGVNNPTQSWQEAALEVGASRFTQSASQAGDQWRNGFSDFQDTLESLSLQPRGPRGSEANFQRSRAVGEALNNERQG